MKGAGRPCENSTVNIVILPPDYRVKIEYVLIPNSGEKFLGRSHRAKTTEICAKWCPCPQTSRRLPPPLAYRELHERRGETVRCAAAFCIARFLARCLSPDHSLLRSVYFFAQGMCLPPISGESFSLIGFFAAC